VAVATAAIIVLRILSAALQPRRFASPEERRVDGAIRCRQLQPIAMRRTSKPTPFQRRGCGLPVGLLGPCGAFTEPCRPLTFHCHPQAHPSRNPFRPMCCPITGLQTLRLTEAGVELTCWSEDPTSPQQFPTTTGLIPETPSVVFETCELSPTSGRLRNLLDSSTRPYRFAFCPSAPVRQAVLRISSWLAPSFATTRPCDRPVKKTRDALNRLLPLKRKRVPAPRAFPIHSATFAAWTSHGD